MSIARRAQYCSVVLFVIGSFAAGCGGSSPTAPNALPPSTAGGTPPPADGTPPRAREQTNFDMTGLVTDEAGAPVAGAKVSIWLDDFTDYKDWTSAQTDSAGRYALQFSGSRGASHYPGNDPPGTEDAIGFVNVEGPGYEPYSRFVLGTSEHLVENVRLRRVQRIAAGESATVTLEPDDSVCVVDVWPGRELICRTLRVVASRDGLMTVDAVATIPVSVLPSLEVWRSDGVFVGAPRTNPTALKVTAGAEYTVRVQLPWSLVGSLSFVVRTALSVP